MVFGVAGGRRTKREQREKQQERMLKFLSKFNNVIDKLKDSDESLTNLKLEKKMKIPLSVFSEFMKALYHNTTLQTYEQLFFLASIFLILFFFFCTRLELIGVKLGEPGAVSLANCLKVNKTIQVILLSRTMIGERGAQHLLKGLQQNIYITSLQIDQDNAAPLSSFALRQLEHLSKAIDELTLTKVGKSTVYKDIKAETKRSIQRYLDENNVFQKVFPSHFFFFC